MSHFLCLRFMILTLLISFAKNGFTQDYPDNISISETGQLESLAEKRMLIRKTTPMKWIWNTEPIIR
jgi:hypothetical protein